MSHIIPLYSLLLALLFVVPLIHHCHLLSLCCCPCVVVCCPLIVTCSLCRLSSPASCSLSCCCSSALPMCALLSIVPVLSSSPLWCWVTWCCLMSIIMLLVVSTPFSPYEQWFIGRVVVLHDMVLGMGWQHCHCH